MGNRGAFEFNPVGREKHLSGRNPSMSSVKRKLEHLAQVKHQFAAKYRRKAEQTSSRPARTRFRNRAQKYEQAAFQLERKTALLD